jgi:acyl carrier protein
MNGNDPLKELLVEFFNLPETTDTADLNQKAVPKWDSLAMVQLITEMQSIFGVQFDLDEIESLGSYGEIREILLKKGVQFMR